MAQKLDLVLASASPRRLELLLQIGLDPTVFAVDIDESIHPQETAAAYVNRLAQTKAKTALQQLAQSALVLGADTAVVIDQQILGKPQNQADAIRMLQLLSGRTHQVFSAVSLCCADQMESALSMSEVTFAPLDLAWCEAYWQTGECADKAGSYAVQGRAASKIQTIHGSYSGIMGLPLFEVCELLQRF